MRTPRDLLKWAEQLDRCAEELRRQRQEIKSGSLLWEMAGREATQASRIVMAALDAEIECVADGTQDVLYRVRNPHSSEYSSWQRMEIQPDGTTLTDESVLWLFRSVICHDVLAGKREGKKDAGMLWLRDVPDEYKHAPPDPKSYGYIDGSQFVPFAPPPTHEPSGFDDSQDFGFLRAEVVDWADACDELAERLRAAAVRQNIADGKLWDQLAENRGVPELSERQFDVLRVLLKYNATSFDRKMPTANIAEIASSGSATYRQFQPAVTDLSNREFVKTKQGRQGGVWLTARGIHVAERL